MKGALAVLFIYSGVVLSLFGAGQNAWARSTSLSSHPNGIYFGLAGAGPKGELTFNFTHRFSSFVRVALGAGIDQDRFPLAQSVLAWTPFSTTMRPFGGTITLAPSLGAVLGYRLAQWWAMPTLGLGIFGESIYFEMGGGVSTMDDSRVRSYLNLGFFF